MKFADKDLYSFFDNETINTIPIYQRNYVWTRDNCINLLNDIWEFYCKNISDEKNDQKYFVGNIIIQKKIEENIIIDGQQRLTTTLLILKAIQNLTKSNRIKEKIDRKIKIQGKEKKPTISLNRQNNFPRLKK